MRIVFMGTPEFATPSLRALVDADLAPIAVYTQPDRPAGRGRQLVSSPVKRAALALGIPIYQPASLRPIDAVEQLASLMPDLIIVAAFGQILRPNVISIPVHGILNVHASLLPRWRGAAPIPAAILAGDQETGVTIMQIDPGLDTGPMLSKAALPIAPDDTTGTLTAKLADLGASLLVRTVPRWTSGEIVPEPQDQTQATLAERIKPNDATIDWSQSADTIARRVRAYQPWPGAQSQLFGKRLIILEADAGPSLAGRPGELQLEGRSGLTVVTGDGSLRLRRLQLEGGKALDVAAFRAGRRDLAGVRLQNP
ncbi:MAG: methionyl-tRNA formyltransferase [Dehalococcoidia bacterium]